APPMRANRVLRSLFRTIDSTPTSRSLCAGDHRSDGGTDLQTSPSAQHQEWAEDAMAVDGRQVTAVPKSRLGKLVGLLASEDIKSLNRAIFVFLGLSETEGITK
ncbi:MAG TPA: hypothetical protein VGI56_11610, partial [Galbitalea sp.]